MSTPPPDEFWFVNGTQAPTGFWSVTAATAEANDCTWPVEEGCVDLSGYDAAVLDRAAILATSALRALTLGRVGGCPRTIRPCSERCMSSGSVVSPYLWAGQWYNNGCVCPSTGCSCTALSETILPMPVGSVVEVRVDGVVLDPTAYRLDDGNRLLRTDGGSWPTCQDMNAAADEPGAFAVTYWTGHPIDRTGMVAMAHMVAEFAKACEGKKCRLPSNVTNISRQGVTMDLSADLFPSQRTGIMEVDLFVSRWNPYSLRTAPRVLSPEVRKGRVPR